MATTASLLILCVITVTCIHKSAEALPGATLGGASASGAFAGPMQPSGGGRHVRSLEDDLKAMPKVCGLRRSSMPDIFTRIVGGAKADRHEFPWQASLQWRFGNFSYHVCGATVLSESWLVTAAHCTKQFRMGELRVVGGEHELGVGEAGEQERRVTSVAEHYLYSASTQENDIALIKVDTPFSMDGFALLPACIPNANQDFSGECLVTGWGKLTENGRSAKLLRKVVVPILEKESCKRNYQDIGYTGPISDSMFCAGYSQGHKDACQGDSGGPLVCRGPADRYVLAGIVSWGIGCARPGVPGVYTQVAHYIDWMRSVVSGSSVFTPRAVGQQTSMHLDDINNTTRAADTQVTQVVAVPRALQALTTAQASEETQEVVTEYEDEPEAEEVVIQEATFPPSIFHTQSEDSDHSDDRSSETEEEESQATHEFEEDYDNGNLDDIQSILYGGYHASNGAGARAYAYHN